MRAVKEAKGRESNLPKMHLQVKEGGGLQDVDGALELLQRDEREQGSTGVRSRWHMTVRAGEVS